MISIAGDGRVVGPRNQVAVRKHYFVPKRRDKQIGGEALCGRELAGFKWWLRRWARTKKQAMFCFGGRVSQGRASHACIQGPLGRAF